MADSRAARRYASALFGVAVRQGELESAERDFQSVVDTWNQNPQIAEAMIRPQVPMEAKRRVWEQLLEGNVSPLVRNFILLLVDRRRIDLIVAAGEEFRRLIDDYRNIVRASVKTAVPLPSDQADALRESLGRRTGKTVLLETEIDSSLIGGIIVRIGDRIIDGSVRGYLANLKRQLAGTR